MEGLQAYMAPWRSLSAAVSSSLMLSMALGNSLLVSLLDPPRGRFEAELLLLLLPVLLFVDKGLVCDVLRGLF